MQKIFLIIFQVLFYTTLLSANKNSWDSIPSALIEGCVSVISGQYSESETDVVVNGVDPLEFQRFYSSASGEGRILATGWTHNHYGLLDDFILNVDGIALRLDFVPGIIADIRHDRNSGLFHVPISAGNFGTGLTNTFKGHISGEDNVKNAIVHMCYYKNKVAYVDSGDGSRKTFCISRLNPKKGKFLLGRMVSDVHLNGNTLTYSYCNDYMVSRIDHHLPSVGKINSIYLSHSGNGCRLTTNGKQWAQYEYEFVGGRKYLSKVSSYSRPDVTYEYSNVSGVGHRLLTRKNMGAGNYLEVKYYKIGENILKLANGTVKTIRLNGGDFSVGRVAQLLQPTSHSEEPHPIATLYYDRPKKPGDDYITKVYHANNKSSSYHYNQAGYLLKIEHEEDSLQHYGLALEGSSSAPTKVVQRMFWGRSDSREKGDIKGFAIGDDEQVVAYKTFKYDKNFNVVEEDLYGSITGLKNGDRIEVDDDGGLVNFNLESYVKKYYFEHPKNRFLLTKEELSPSHYVEYRYQEKSPYLLEEKIDHFESEEDIRELYSYNSSNLLVSTTVENVAPEDSTSKYRFINEATLSMEKDSFGFPLENRRYYFDLEYGCKRLSKRVALKYNEYGFVVSEDIYDGDDCLCSTLENSYGKYNNIVNSKDVLGRTATFDYDEFGRKVYEQGYKDKHYTKYSYSSLGTVLSKKTFYSDTDIVQEIFEYDKSNRLISKSDSYGNKVNLSYSYLGLVKSKKDNSYVLPEHNFKIPFIKLDDKSSSKYDCMGNIASATDPEGNTTKVCYNSHNRPVRRSFPDGTEELFFYDILGRLIEKRSQHETRMLYTYDDRDRLVKEVHLGADGKTFYFKSCRYNSFFMLESIENGIKKTFEYDGKGSLIAEEETDLVTGVLYRSEFTYDALGRRKSIRKFFEDGTYVEYLTSYDIVNRITEEITRDSLDNILEKKSYIYDRLDNKVVEETEAGGKIKVSYYDYNSHNDIIKSTDPLGSKTYYEYDYSYQSREDKASPRVTEVVITDPSGVKTITVMNVLQEVESTEKVSLSGELLSYEVNSYNLNRQKLGAYYLNSGTKDKGRWTLFHWRYGPGGRLKSYEQMSEPYSLLHNRKTFYSYNKNGLLSATIITSSKKEGAIIYNGYDAAGRALYQYDDNRTFSYSFGYDIYNNVTCADDGLNFVSVYRDYDGHGHVIHEEIGEGGLEVSTVYDSFNRISEQTLPANNGIVYYDYDHLNLKSVLWNGYQHTYDKFDSYNKVESSTMIGNAGVIGYEWDLLGRPLKVEHDLWQEDMSGSYDAVGNLTNSIVYSSDTVKNNSYQYDDLRRLVSEDGSIENKYTYDFISNRTSKNEREYLLNPLNELKKAEGYKYTYDGLGNITSKYNKYKRVNYQYDSLNRLTSIEGIGDSRIEFVYDAFNRRIIKKEMGWDADFDEWDVSREDYFFYHDQKELGSCNEFLHTKELRVLGYGLGAEVGAAIMISVDEAEVYAPIHDHNGNVVALIDSLDGSLVETYTYDAFGIETIYNNYGEEVKGSAVGNPWRFSSKRTDDDNGLVYFGKRYYSPEVGRWLSIDPKGHVDGPNLYAYVLNAPLTHLDLYGEYTARGAYKSASDGFKRSFSTARDWTSRRMISLGQRMGNNFPGLMVEGIGNKLERKSFYTKKKHRAMEYSVGEQYSQNYNERIGYENGILNDDDDFKRGLGLLSSNLQSSVSGIHNPSRSFTTDMIEVLANIFNIKTEAVRKTTHHIISGIDEMDRLETQEKGRFVQCAFSHGTYIVKRAIEDLPDKYAARVHVITCGGTSIPSDRVASSISYACLGDPVPFLLDPLNMAKKLSSGKTNIIFAKPDSLADAFKAHRWDNNAYQRAVVNRYRSLN